MGVLILKADSTLKNNSTCNVSTKNIQYYFNGNSYGVYYNQSIFFSIKNIKNP